MLKSLFSKPYSRLYIVGDNADWAIDEEAKSLEKTARSLKLSPSRIKKAWLNVPQLVHYSSQFSLLDKSIYKSRHRISVDYFHGKPEDGESYKKCLEALKAHPEVSIRVSNSEVMRTLLSAGISKERLKLIHIGVDLPLFELVNKDARLASRDRLGIPLNAVVVGSFQKDGVGWGEGNEPKPIKGPDTFIKVVEKLHKEIPNLYVLLSGPSRGYVKNELTRLGINFKHEFVKTYGKVGQLYDALDLYLITSREEGGPKSCLESMAKGIPLVTTAVGQCIDLVKNNENALMAPIDDVEQLFHHSLSILKDPVLAKRLSDNGLVTARENSLTSLKILWQKFFEEIKLRKTAISIFHEFHKPPYGGGNQFLLALEKEFIKKGVMVKRNVVDENTRAVLFNSFNFDFKKLQDLKMRFSALMVHRVDGPISVYRNENPEVDQKIWSLNHDLADRTIFQSQYSLNKHLEMGLVFKEPVIIPNTCDPAIFNSIGRISDPQGKRKTKLIATSWSDNPKKGGPILSWLDENLDHEKYELTFVGRTKATFKNAMTMAAVPSEELANLLKQHDLYLAPSQDDPCSNALIEALSCGLPAVFLDSGGHPELVGEGGVAFNGIEDLKASIDKASLNLASYRAKIMVPTLSEIADKYLSILK